MNQKLNLSICVVLYRAREVTEQFISEIVNSLDGFSEYEILFYDNSPDDSLRSLCNGFFYVSDPRNMGFSYANNRLILEARYENILLLNPDVFGFSASFWSELAIGMVDADQARFIKLLNPDGSHQDCVGRCTSLSRPLRRPIDYASLREPTIVEMGIMAFMLTRKSVFARVGLLDCDYPLYAEDMDWCYRAGRAGIPLIYDPSLSLTHLGGGTATDRWTAGESRRRKYLAERIFVDKHARGWRWTALRGLNLAKLVIKGR